MNFLLARVSPGGYLGLHLTVGILLLIGASWIFGGIAEDVVTGDPLIVADNHVAEWFHHRMTQRLTAVIQVISDLGSPLWVTCISAGIGLALLWKRRWYRLLAWALVIPGGVIVGFFLKLAFHRSRPSFEDASFVFQGFGFPSGHTMIAVLLYGLLAAFAVRSFDARRWRALSVAGAGIMVLLIGLSRLYLGAHFVSDVLGGIASGVAWLALSLTAAETLRRNRGHRSKP